MNIKNLTTHYLRHTFASISLQNGISILSLQQILGHSSIRTTQIYVHANQDRTKNDYDRYSHINDYILDIKKNQN